MLSLIRTLSEGDVCSNDDSAKCIDKSPLAVSSNPRPELTKTDPEDVFGFRQA